MTSQQVPKKKKSQSGSAKSDRSAASLASSQAFKQMLITPKTTESTKAQAASQAAFAPSPNPFALRSGFIFPDGTEIKSIFKLPRMAGAQTTLSVTFFHPHNGQSTVEYVDEQMRPLRQVGYLL